MPWYDGIKQEIGVNDIDDPAFVGTYVLTVQECVSGYQGTCSFCCAGAFTFTINVHDSHCRTTGLVLPTLSATSYIHMMNQANTVVIFTGANNGNCAWTDTVTTMYD